MKKRINRCQSALIALCLLVGLSSQSQAAIIIQDIFAGANNIATVEVSIDESLLGNGIYDSFFDTGAELFAVTLLGNRFFPDELNIYDFSFIFDTDNIQAGFEAVFFDLDETGFFDNWAYQVAFDIFNPGFVDIFNSTGGIVFASSTVSVGPVTVPTPHGLGLLACGLAMLRLRRS